MEMRKEETEEEKEEDINYKNDSDEKDIIQKKENEINMEIDSNNKKAVQKENEEIEKEEEIDLESTSTYILKYTRKGDELKEISVETGLRKSENCLFMLNIKLIKSDSVLTPENDNNINPNENSETFLVFCCHEIAAIYFDEIYERVYTLDDLIKENKHFRSLDSTEEAKNIIDKTIRKNEKNDKKIFLSFKNSELKLHMKLSFFDEDKEIVLNIPKKILTDEDKINLLPEFLKEIQDKMNHLSEENKKMRIKKTKAYNNRIKEIKDNYRANNTFNFDININDKEKEKDESDKKNENINKINSENNSINTSSNITKKIKKKVKVVKKKQIKPEENFF